MMGVQCSHKAKLHIRALSSPYLVSFSLHEASCPQPQPVAIPPMNVGAIN